MGFLPNGTVVEIVDKGKQYSTYDEQAKYMGLTEYKHWKLVKNGERGHVLSCRYALSGVKYIYGVRLESGFDVMLGTKGVKKIVGAEGNYTQPAVSKPIIGTSNPRVIDMDKVLEGVKILAHGFDILEARVIALEAKLKEVPDCDKPLPF